MKLRSLGFSFVFAASAVVVACSSSSESAADGGAAAPTPGTQADLDAAIAKRIAAYCDRIFGCCDSASQSKLLGVYANGISSRDKCEDAVKEFLKPNVTAASTALQRKELVFYPSKEADCLKQEADKSCADFFALGPATEPQVACSDALTGQVKDGAGCTINAACASKYCKLDGESGVCAKFPQEGDPCGSTVECGGAGDLYCYRTSAPPACKFVDGVCKARESKADGQPCCNPEECEGQSCNPNQKGQPVCNHSNALKCNK